MSITIIHSEEYPPMESASGSVSQNTSWNCSARRLMPSRTSAEVTPTTRAGTTRSSSRRAEADSESAGESETIGSP
ncbi:hypothetical protein [Streptomyces sp. NPDC005125]